MTHYLYYYRSQKDEEVTHVKIETVQLSKHESRSLQRLETICIVSAIATVAIVGTVLYWLIELATPLVEHSPLLYSFAMLLGLGFGATTFVITPGLWVQIYNRKSHVILYDAGWTGTFPYRISTKK